MYLGDHRWLVSPPNQYLVTDGVYRRQTAALQTADCLWGLCLLHSPSAASLRGKRVRSLPRRTLSSLNWPIMSHLAPHPEPTHPAARASPWKHTQTRYEWWSLTGPIGGKEGSRAGVAMVIWRQRDTPASSCCHRDTECMSSNAQQDRNGGGFSERAQICKRRSLAG